MKNISYTLTILLLVAVIFLFYKVYSGVSTTEEASNDQRDTAVAPLMQFTPKTLADLPEGVPFSFVNADTIFARYDYAVKTQKAGEGRVDDYRRSYQNKAEQFQKEYEDYVQKAGQGAYSREQGEAIEAGLAKKRDNLMAMEQNQEKILAELDQSTVQVNKRINDFLKRFNREHGYHCTLAYTLTGGGILGINDSLDVTEQVIDGLNKEYNAGGK